MNYDYFSKLPLNVTLRLLRMQIDSFLDTSDPLFLGPVLAQDHRLPAPTLCLIGHFEIRARFHEKTLHQSDLDDYNELLYAVVSKFPGESRHETALRYIQQAERETSGPACEPNPPPEA